MTLIDSKTAGSRPATRVRIATPQGSVYDGRVGTVVEERHGMVVVRLDPLRGASSLFLLTIGFAPGEIKEIK